MAKITTWDVSIDNDKYTFSTGDTNLKIEGTIKEIAYRLFIDYVNAPKDKNGIVQNHEFGPFYLFDIKDEVTGNITFEGVPLFATFSSDPGPEFFKELDTQIRRFMLLKAFA
jgi:hypothetical protein